MILVLCGCVTCHLLADRVLCVRLLQSAKGMFEHHRVDNVVMEYTPGAWEGNNKWEDYPSVPGMLE